MTVLIHPSAIVDDGAEIGDGEPGLALRACLRRGTDRQGRVVGSKRFCRQQGGHW